MANRRPIPGFLRIAVSLCLAASILGATGCGYRLQPVQGGRFADPSLVVDLPPFDNRSFDPDVGAFLSAVLREDLRRSGFRGSFGRAGANRRIEGRVLEVEEAVATHGKEGFALERVLTLRVSLKVTDAVRGNTLLEERALSEGTAYFSGPDFQYTESNRRMALEEACRRLARRIGHSLRMVL
jgi:hypothetical protein